MGPFSAVLCVRSVGAGTRSGNHPLRDARRSVLLHTKGAAQSRLFLAWLADLESSGVDLLNCLEKPSRRHIFAARIARRYHAAATFERATLRRMKVHTVAPFVVMGIAAIL